jgi:selenocysteine lyase/cysteine desulfurase
MPLLAGAASIAAALGTDHTPEEWDARMYQCNQLVTRLTDMLRSEADVVVIGSGTQSAKSTSLRRCGLLSFYVKGLSTHSLGKALASQGHLVDVGNHGVGLFLRESIGMTETVRLFLDPELADGDFLHSFMSALRDAMRELRSSL